MINLSNVSTPAYGYLDKEYSSCMTRIYNTLQVDSDDGELVVQFSSPSELAKWCSITKEQGTVLYKYLLDNQILIQDIETPRLIFNYQHLPDRFKAKYFK